MSFVYSLKNGSKIGISNGTITIDDGENIETIPQSLVEGISVFGQSQISAQCIKHCMTNGISVSFFSMSGNYYGTIESDAKSNVNRLRKQISMADNAALSLEMSKKIIDAKINNQIIVAKRYSNNKERINALKMLRKKISSASNKQSLMGYEGLASRVYFLILSEAVHSEFSFKKRSKRPARDPFNAMLNIGYSMLHKEIKGELINCGLNPYISFLHEERNGHAALASDLIEEWRPVIVDSAVMSAIQGNEVSIDGFTKNEGGDWIVSSYTMKKLIAKLETKMRQLSKYLLNQESSVTYRQAIWHQARDYVKVVESGNANFYQPIEIR